MNARRRIQEHLKNDRMTMEAFKYALDAFDGDRNKAGEWFHQPNRELNGKSPIEMVGIGQAEHLIVIMKEALKTKPIKQKDLTVLKTPY